MLESCRRKRNWPHDFMEGSMKHRIKIKVPVEKKGLFGRRHTVLETRTVEVDGKTYRKLKREQEKDSFSLEEMMLYDLILEED